MTPPSTSGPPERYPDLTGTPAQIEWAERIRVSVAQEFDRVAGTLAGVARPPASAHRLDLQPILAILSAKRAAVLAHPEAGYFIREWQELSDQVRRMILQDPAYQDSKIRRTE